MWVKPGLLLHLHLSISLSLELSGLVIHSLKVSKWNQVIFFFLNLPLLVVYPLLLWFQCLFSSSLVRINFTFLCTVWFVSLYIVDKSRIVILLVEQFIFKLTRNLKNKVTVNMISNAVDERERYLSEIIHGPTIWEGAVRVHLGVILKQFRFVVISYNAC
jgi:hypothetical protein